MSTSEPTQGTTESIVSSHIPKVELFEARPGAKVDGRFELIKKIGEGGMGVVYLAKQINIGRDVVIKLLKPHLCSNEEQVNRFRREASLASRLSHPNCVTIHDFGFYQGTPYIVMEYLEGAPLVEILHHRGRLPLAETINILSQTCDALEAARALEVVHRDLKPENVFILREAIGSVTVKVLDFGIAKLAHTHPEASDSNLTRGDMIFGTPQYMSPEQIRGKPIDHRADVYALTVIFYEMMAGTLPYDQEDSADVVSILTQHLRDPIPMLTASQLSPEAAPLLDEVNALLSRGMAKLTDERIASADELKERLTKLADQAKMSPQSRTPEPSLTPQDGAPRMTRSGIFLSPLDQISAAPSAHTIEVGDLLPPVSERSAPDASISAEPSLSTGSAEQFTVHHQGEAMRESRLLQPSPTLSSPDLSSLSPAVEGRAPKPAQLSFLSLLARGVLKFTFRVACLALLLSVVFTYPRSPLARGKLRRLIKPYISASTSKHLRQGEVWITDHLSPIYTWVDQKLGLQPVSTPAAAGMPREVKLKGIKLHRGAPPTPKAPSQRSLDPTPPRDAQPTQEAGTPTEKSTEESLDGEQSSNSPERGQSTRKRAPRLIRVVRDYVSEGK